MSGYRAGKRAAAWVCLLLAVLLSLSPAVAAEYGEDPYVFVVFAGEERDEPEDVRIGSLQDRLTELGYYSGSKTFRYDAETRYAVYRFCTENGMAYDDGGLRQSQWDALMRSDAPPAGELILYPDLAFGDSGDAVLALQTRLKELNYYAGGLILAPGTFDDATQTAVTRFCQTNGIAYEGPGAPAAVQRFIFAEGAAAYTLPVEEKPLPEKISDYMMQDADVLVETVPMFVVWLVAAALLLLIAAVLAHFFIREKKKQTNDTAVTPRFRPAAPEQDAVSQEKLHSGADRRIGFQIEYQGRVSNLRLDCGRTLTVGRGTGDLALDPGDTLVSRSHCELGYKGAVLMLRDHSRNGTLLNGSTVHNAECRVNNGDVLTIGAHTISIQF